MDDLRRYDCGVWVRRGKGGKPRLAGMDPESFEALGPWLELRGELGLDPAGPAFCTFSGNALESSCVRHICRRLRTRLGLSKRVHDHALRRTYAHVLFREGAAEKLTEGGARTGHRDHLYRAS